MFDDGIEHAFIEVDQIHFVDRQQHVVDAQTRDDETVPAGLGQHAFAGVDQHHGDIGGGRAGGHVAGVLFMARAIGHDELAFVGGKEAVGHIDGDALLAFGGQAVDQQREIHGFALGAVLGGIFFQRGQLVVEQALGVVQQAPDQGALAVVDAAAGDEAQQGFGFVLLQVGADIGGHQK